MSDYIKREDVIKLACSDCEPYSCDKNCTLMQILKMTPAADVVERKHGKWKPRDLTWGRSYYYCSACEETVDMPTAMGIPMFCYCPNCGADMRGDPDV